MSFSKVINYDTPGDFVYDNTKVEITTLAQLLISSLSFAFNESFDSDTGFTYDAAKTEFVSNLMRQKDAIPSDSLLGANWTSSINAYYNVGSLVPTSTAGSPTITGGKLDLTVPSSNVIYDAQGTINPHHGTIKVKYTPKQSGTPSATQQIFYYNEGAANNRTSIEHLTGTGALQLTFRDSTGGSSTTINLGVWNPTADQEYEISVNWDFTTSSEAHRVFIDGVQFGSTNTTAMTRSNNLTEALILRIGGVGTYASNMLLDDLMVFTAVQHTANYTPGYTLAKYLEDTITLPTFNYTGLNSILSLDSMTVTEVGSPRYIIEGKYWSGVAWVASDNSYAQATDLATVNTSLSSFDTTGLTSITVKVVFPEDEVIQSSVDSMVLNHMGQGYNISEPSITEAVGEAVDSLSNLVVVSSTPAGTDIRFHFTLNGQPRYWTGAAWADSDGSFAQSNSVADINTNLASFFNHISPLGGTVKLVALLDSDGGDTPTLTTVSYSFSSWVAQVSLDKCELRGYILDNCVAQVGATVTVKTSKPYFLNDNAISVNETAVTNSVGYFELTVPRGQDTADAGGDPTLFEFTATWVDANGTTQTQEFKVLTSGISITAEDAKAAAEAA